MGLKDKYAIVGVGYTPQGVVPGRSALSFQLEAAANAIKDAGLKKTTSTALSATGIFPLQPASRMCLPIGWRSTWVLSQHISRRMPTDPETI